MATEYRINMKRYNGTDYDIMYPKTLTEQVINGQRQIIVDSITIGTSWTGSGPYTQTVTVDNADANSKVDIQADATIIQKLIDAGTTALYIVNNDGVFSAVALGAAPTEALTIQCTITKTAAPPPPVLNSVLNENSWRAIKWASENNVGQNYWAVGDTKKIVLNGKVSDGLTLDNFETYVYIIGFNHNEALEGKGITFQGFKTAQTGGVSVALVDSGYMSSKTSGQWFNMFNSKTNTGGWQSSLMRTVTMPLIKAAFPSELQAAIKTSTIYTDSKGASAGSVEANVTATQDDVYLLSECEIESSYTHSNSYEKNKQQRYAYYANGNSTIKYSHNSTGTACHYSTRSDAVGTSDRFAFVYPNGDTNVMPGSVCGGVAPAFRV